MEAQTFYAVTFLQFLQQDDKLTLHLLTSQPNLPAIPSKQQTQVGQGRGMIGKVLSRSSVWQERKDKLSLKDTQVHKHTRLCHQDPVPCNCLKRPSRIELKQMLEVL